ncbi:hypothetical protein GCM10028805_51660 [Spirosoma harenae]
MFGLDPFNLPVAITEMVILLAVAAFIGWLLSRLALAGRINTLQESIERKQAELDDCRWIKKAGKASGGVTSRPQPIIETPPAFVHADPLLPAIAPDETPELIDADIKAPIVNTSPEVITPIVPEPVVIKPVPEVSPVAAVIPPAPASILPPVTTGNSEAAVLSRIAARASEINFDRIGRATAAEADDLKTIVGVGPFLERKLHSLGIYTFRQVANFTKEDIDKVNEIIEFFPGRIERDNWVEQSIEFYQKKYGRQNS